MAAGGVKLWGVCLDISVIANEAGRNLGEWFVVWLGADARQYGCLVGCLFIGGF